MEISVQLFAGLREVMESDLLTVRLHQDLVSVALLRQALEEQYPKLKPYLSGVAIAVNEEYILSDESELADGDSVALVPPIAGGF
ncbi:MAG TPA: MoaD/ThiS family protein [Dehalococcoidia bacterium]|jgi:molybdopterin converting factor subunit 1|nr:MoaD/ThiS family protein [Dehalococcoidia bacterium]